MTFLLGVVAVLLARVLWPPLSQFLPIPDHLLHGDSRRSSLWVQLVLTTVPLATVVGVLWLIHASTPTTLWVRVSALVGVFGVLAVVHRRPVRSMAARVRDHAVVLTVVSLLFAQPLATVVGGAVGVVLLAGVGALIVIDWGRQGRYVWFSTPAFRALGHNPDNQNGVARLWVGQGGLHIHVPNNDARTTTLTVYNQRMRRVAVVANASLSSAFSSGGPATIRLGPDVSADDALAVCVPPGRYFSTVRYYLPADAERSVLPHAQDSP